MITLTVGKTLGPGDISIMPRDASGAAVDPAVITYSIFQTDKQINLRPSPAYSYDQMQPNHLPSHTVNPEALLVYGPKQIPNRASQGAYYIPITIPTTWHGVFKVVWYLTQYQGGQENQVIEEFAVQNIDPASNSFEAPSVMHSQPPLSKTKYAPAIMYVRELLSDDNPDRNYHFRPPTPSKVVAGFTTRVGYIWTDTTILRLLDIAISKLNTWNPMNLTNYDIDHIPPAWLRCAAVGAAAACLSREGCRWAEEEFNYSLNGVSLDINKAALYQSLGQQLQGEFTEWAPLITANRPGSVGLRQQRWLLGSLIPPFLLDPSIIRWMVHFLAVSHRS